MASVVVNADFEVVFYVYGVVEAYNQLNRYWLKPLKICRWHFQNNYYIQIQVAEECKNPIGIGTLTTSDRETWAKVNFLILFVHEVKMEKLTFYIGYLPFKPSCDPGWVSPLLHEMRSCWNTEFKLTCRRRVGKFWGQRAVLKNFGPLGPHFWKPKNLQ